MFTCDLGRETQTNGSVTEKNFRKAATGGQYGEKKMGSSPISANLSAEAAVGATGRASGHESGYASLAREHQPHKRPGRISTSSETPAFEHQINRDADTHSKGQSQGPRSLGSLESEAPRDGQLPSDPFNPNSGRRSPNAPSLGIPEEESGGPYPRVRSRASGTTAAPFPRISSPVELLRSSYDCVVIGSGYGGGVAASRMARAGQSVCVLERGQERWPGEYPSGPLEAYEQVHCSGTRAPHWMPGKAVDGGNPTGMFHVMLGNGLHSVVCNGEQPWMVASRGAHICLLTRNVRSRRHQPD